MIISANTDEQPCEFEKLLTTSKNNMDLITEKDASYFSVRSPAEFEEDVYENMRSAAKKTPFEDTIELISGHKFPDIVANCLYGVEVKATKRDHWRSTGNSVLESTRVEDVKKIYIFFGKLNIPTKFKFRRYEECLYDVAVTHSPRYLIDMDLNVGECFFDKIGLGYDELRSQENPIRQIVSYYRSIAKHGEEPWWMDTGEDPEINIKPTVTLWSNLSSEEQAWLRNEAMARFPEVFSKSSTKYQRLASWLAARHGIVDSSLRDRFSAGGQVDLVVDNHVYKKLPRVFLHLQNNASEVIEAVKNIPPNEAKYYWNLPFEPNQNQKLSEWTGSLISSSGKLIYDSEKFIVHLLGMYFSEKKCPDEVKERLVYYGLDK